MLSFRCTLGAPIRRQFPHAETESFGSHHCSFVDSTLACWNVRIVVAEQGVVGNSLSVSLVTSVATLRADSVDTLEACINVDHIGKNWEPPLVDADWLTQTGTPVCQAIFEGMEGRVSR